MFPTLPLLFHTSIQTKQCLCLLPIPQDSHCSPLLLSVETQSCTAYLITGSSPSDCTSFSSLPPTKARAAQPPSWQPPLEECTFYFLELGLRLRLLLQAQLCRYSSAASFSLSSGAESTAEAQSTVRVLTSLPVTGAAIQASPWWSW